MGWDGVAGEWMRRVGYHPRGALHGKVYVVYTGKGRDQARIETGSGREWRACKIDLIFVKRPDEVDVR